MARVRVSTTVDEHLLAEARERIGGNDATLLDAALAALLSHHRAAEVDAAYVAAYEETPLDTADEWGDLASFLAAGDRTGRRRR